MLKRMNVNYFIYILQQSISFLAACMNALLPFITVFSQSIGLNLSEHYDFPLVVTFCIDILGKKKTTLLLKGSSITALHAEQKTGDKLKVFFTLVLFDFISALQCFQG